MPVSAEFAYRAARQLMLAEADPWSSWAVAPLSVSASSIQPDAAYDPAWEAFAPQTIGDWDVVAYVAPGVPPPPAEALPYAELATSPDPWTNDGEDPVTVRTIAVIGWTGTAWQLLFWQPLAAPVTVEPLQTFEITQMRFELVELADL